MPFDSLDAPPEWRSPPPAPRPRPVIPDDPLTRREKLVAVLLGGALAAMALGQCGLLLLLRHG